MTASNRQATGVFAGGGPLHAKWHALSPRVSAVTVNPSGPVLDAAAAANVVGGARPIARGRSVVGGAANRDGPPVRAARRADVPCARSRRPARDARRRPRHRGSGRGARGRRGSTRRVSASRSGARLRRASRGAAARSFRAPARGLYAPLPGPRARPRRDSRHAPYASPGCRTAQRRSPATRARPRASGACTRPRAETRRTRSAPSRRDERRADANRRRAATRAPQREPGVRLAHCEARVAERAPHEVDGPLMGRIAGGAELERKRRAVARDSCEVGRVAAGARVVGGMDDHRGGRLERRRREVARESDGHQPHLVDGGGRAEERGEIGVGRDEGSVDRDAGERVGDRGRVDRWHRSPGRARTRFARRLPPLRGRPEPRPGDTTRLPDRMTSCCSSAYVVAAMTNARARRHAFRSSAAHGARGSSGGCVARGHALRASAPAAPSATNAPRRPARNAGRPLAITASSVPSRDARVAIPHRPIRRSRTATGRPRPARRRATEDRRA